MTRGKIIFCHEHFDFEKQVKRRNQQKQQLEKNKRVSGRHRKKRDERRREEKKGERWADATNVPGPRSMTSECT